MAKENVMYIHNGVFEIMSFSGKWMELEMIMLSEISQSHKHHMFSLICGIYGGKNPRS
jgi:hypothetical protein